MRQLLKIEDHFEHVLALVRTWKQFNGIKSSKSYSIYDVSTQTRFWLHLSSLKWISNKSFFFKNLSFLQNRKTSIICF